MTRRRGQHHPKASVPDELVTIAVLEWRRRFQRSYAEIVGELKQRGFTVSIPTVKSWCLGARRFGVQSRV